jgi:Spy/CpxP family protein refolding chaperone
MKYNLLGLAVLLFSFVLITDAVAQSGRGRGGGGKNQGWRLSGLNLTQDQQEKINELRNNHWNETSKLKNDLDRLRIDKREMMSQKEVNKNDYLNIEKKMSSLREKIHLSGAEFRMNVYEILDADQREQFSQGNFNTQKRGRAGAGFRNNFQRGYCR